MEAWMLLWKIVLIAGVILFGLMAIWVTIWGALDIKKLLKSLNTEHETRTSEPDQEDTDKKCASSDSFVSVK